MTEEEKEKSVLLMLRDGLPEHKIIIYERVSRGYIKKIREKYAIPVVSGDEEELKAGIQSTCLMDDISMSICLSENIAGAERIVNTVIPDKEFEVVEAHAQYSIPNGFGHNAILDVLAKDKYGNKIDIEIQNDSDEAIPRRARYYSSMLDYSMLASGVDYRALKESYVIFITRYDVLKGGRQLYTVDRMIDGTDMKFSDGSHIAYVNCEIQDDTPLGKLIHDLLCVEPEEMYYAELRERMSYLKKTEEGVKEMTGKLAEYVEKKMLAAAAESERMLRASAERERKWKEEAEENERKLQEEAEEKRKLKEEAEEKDRKLQEEAEEKRKLKEEAAATEQQLQFMKDVLGVTGELDPEKIPLLRDYIKCLNDYK